MNAWKDFVTASLLGTEKGAPLPVLPAALEETLGPSARLAREARFLTHAGAIALWRRAGLELGQSTAAPPPPAPPETVPLVGPASVAHLRAMLGGYCADVLPEWLGEAVRGQRRPPPEWLPALLEWGRANRVHRPAVMAAGGTRGRWLAARNPDWNFAADDSPEHWETGSRDQRFAVLRRWRAENPAEAREKLEAVWEAEPADVRAGFLALLADDLCDGDAPFLERALDDRGREVRAAAVGLLSRLSDSPFAGRMIARATPLLVFRRGSLLCQASLEITLPDLPDAAAQRDGLDAKNTGAHRAFGEKAGLLAQILAAVPLPHWTHTFAKEPAALLKAAETHDFARAVITGWTRAALRQGDAAWAEALLDAPAEVQAPAEIVPPGALSGLLPDAARGERLRARIRQNGLGHRESWPETEALIRSFRSHLPVPVARDILGELRVLAGIELPWHLRYFQTVLATKIPPNLLPLALDDWPEPNPAADFVGLLAFRRDALAALAQP